MARNTATTITTIVLALLCIVSFALAADPCEILAQDIQALNREQQYVFTFTELLVLGFSDKGLKKKMESYCGDVLRLYELHAIEPAPTRMELDLLWKHSMRKQARWSILLMSGKAVLPGTGVLSIPACLNGPQMISLAAWENFKAAVVGMAQQHCEPGSAKTAEQIITAVSI